MRANLGSEIGTSETSAIRAQKVLLQLYIFFVLYSVVACCEFYVIFRAYPFQWPSPTGTKQIHFVPLATPSLTTAGQSEFTSSP